MAIARTKAVGWAAFEVLTSAQANSLDQSSVLATDRRVVPDYFGRIAFPTYLQYANDIRDGVFDSVHNNWVFIGGVDGTPASRTSTDGVSTNAGGAVAGGSNWSVRSMACSSAGVVVAMGNINAGTARVRRSTDGGASWSSASFGVATDNFDCVVWHEGQSCFIAVGKNSGTGVALIYTSVDAGVTWVQQTMPAGWPANTGLNLVSSGTVLVAFAPGIAAATTNYLYTTNAFDWSSSLRSLGISTNINSAFWADDLKMFIAPGQPTLRGDGLRWVSSGNIAADTTFPEQIAAYKGFAVAVGPGSQLAWGSSDHGATWRVIFDGFSGNYFRVKYGQGRFILFNLNTSGSAPSLRFAL